MGRKKRGFLRLAAALAALGLALLCAGCGAAGSQTAAGSAAGTAASAGTGSAAEASTPAQPAGQIYLYGESHSNEGILNRELELWGEYYAQGMRHLFIESPYYSAEMLNLWMQAEDDTLLDARFEEIKGTAGGTETAKNFYRTIKREMPETVFHGTDVGHQYWSSGPRYLELLRAQGQEDSEQYRRAEEVMRQGAFFYTGQTEDLSEEYLNDHFLSEDELQYDYRENCMVENFIRAFDQLEGESVMGIYGDAHVPLDGTAYYSETLPGMGNQLCQHYGAEAVHSESLMDYFTTPEPTPLAMPAEPLSTETPRRFCPAGRLAGGAPGERTF